jgi:hypothetical protein
VVASRMRRLAVVSSLPLYALVTACISLIGCLHIDNDYGIAI